MKFVIVLLSIVIASCAASSNFKWDSVRALKIGMTRQEVIQRLGPPQETTVQNTPEGLKETYEWFYVTYDFIGTSTHSISIEFLNGKVIAVPTVPERYKEYH